MTGTEANKSGQRLDSWKEIAVFFDRDEKTVRRWEKEFSLPVYRYPGSRGRVYAFASELNEWARASRPQESDDLVRRRESGSATGRDSARVSDRKSDIEASPAPTAIPSPILISQARLTAPEPLGPASNQVFILPVRHGLAPLPAPDLDHEQDQEQDQERDQDGNAREGVAREPWPSSRRSWFLLVAAVALFVAVCSFWIFSRRNATGSTSAANSSGGIASANRHSGYEPVPEAEKLYLSGRYAWNKRTPEALNQAVDFFTQAIVRDPGYAKPYVGLADTYNLLREYSAMPDAEAFPRAFAAASKAVQLDPSSAEAHASLGFILFYWKWDAPAAEREFRRAIALDPSYADAYHWFGNILANLGRYPEALVAINRAQQLDNSSPSIRADKAITLFNAGEREESILMLKQMTASDPAFVSPHRYLTGIYQEQSDCANYLSEFASLARMTKDAVAFAQVAEQEKAFAAGGCNGMLRILEKTRQQDFATGKGGASSLASIQALLGEKAAAIQTLNEGVRRHDTTVLYIRSSLALSSLHNEPGFRQLLANIGLPPVDGDHP